MPFPSPNRNALRLVGAVLATVVAVGGIDMLASSCGNDSGNKGGGGNGGGNKGGSSHQSRPRIDRWITNRVGGFAHDVRSGLEHISEPLLPVVGALAIAATDVQPVGPADVLPLPTRVMSLVPAEIVEA